MEWMRRHCAWTGVLAWQATVGLLCPPAAGQTERYTMTKQHRIAGEADAISVAKQMTGFGALKAVAITAQRVRVESDNTPFLARQIIGTSAWRVEFDNISLVLKSATKGFKDPYRRKFITLIQEDTGQLWSVKSFSEEPLPDVRPEPSAEAAEAQLRPEREIYEGLPVENPKCTFLDALDIVLSRGVGSPFLAKEIHAVYVMESERDSVPRPVWAVTLRGIPAISVSRGSVPEWQRNRMRNVVEANTGKLLFATNSPQPE
jgi:hypothetical protein